LDASVTGTGEIGPKGPARTAHICGFRSRVCAKWPACPGTRVGLIALTQ
jgi:hypothetical protein